MNMDRIEGAARAVGGKAQDLAGRATGSPQTRAEGLANEAAGMAQNLYGRAVDEARDATDAIASYAERAYERGSRYLQQGEHSAEQQITQHPLIGIMLAGALGVLLGVALTSMRR